MRRLLPLVCLGLACTLRGDGEFVEEARELPVFTGIEVFDGFTATVTVDPAVDAATVVVGGDGNALERLFTVMHAEATLSVAVDPNELSELSLTPTLTATVPALRSGFVEDSSSLEIRGPSGALGLVVREAGSVMVHAGAALSVSATVSDDGELTLAGSGPALELVVEGDATVEAGAFAAAAVTVRARGTGEIRVCATETIRIFGGGAGQVELGCD